MKWVRFKTNKKLNCFEFDRKAFEESITEKTKVVFFNNPHNPVGLVFTKEDLEFVSRTIQKYPNLICIADEVYEKFAFDGREHLRLASLPGMWDRTISIFSSGKVFSSTGWRVGFSIAPSHLTRYIGSFQTWNVYCLNTLAARSTQLGMKIALSQPYEGYPSYYEWLNKTFNWRSNKITSIVNNSNLDLHVIPLYSRCIHLKGDILLLPTSKILSKRSLLNIFTKIRKGDQKLH